MLLNFLVVGAQKAGTTSLHNYLAAHPDIYLPAGKETKFFVDDERYALGIEWYQREHFGKASRRHAVGEVDPDYMYFPSAVERIQAVLGLDRIKLIFVFRNPVERAFSHYLMTYRRGLEPLSFEAALEAEPERIRRDYLSNMHYSYASRGFYLEQVERFLAHTSIDNMLFLLTEELTTDPGNVLRRVTELLGVDSSFQPQHLGERYHVGTAPRSMGLLRRIKFGDGFEKKLLRALMPERQRKRLRQTILNFNQTSDHGIVLDDGIRAALEQRFAAANAALGGLIGRDLSHWGPAPARSEAAS